MSNASDFIIENGVLTKYVGPGGDVTIPEGITEIGDSAFSVPETADLKSISFPNSLLSIGIRAFYGQTKLKKIVFPQNLRQISSGAFADCKGIKVLEFPNVMPQIQNMAFMGCKGLADEAGFLVVNGSLAGYFQKEPFVKVPETVTKIEPYVFSSNKKVQEVEIPETVTEICTQAFLGCGSLQRIHIPHSVTVLENYAFSACTALQRVDLQANLTEIENGLFSGCNALENIHLPQGIHTIGKQAFRCCNHLTSITIPDTVTQIGEHAFTDCRAYIQIKASAPVQELFWKSLTESKDKLYFALYYLRNIGQIPCHLADVDTFIKKSKKSLLKQIVTMSDTTAMTGFLSVLRPNADQADELLQLCRGNTELTACILEQRKYNT